MTHFVEIPASNKSLAMRKPVNGIGINDAWYLVTGLLGGRQVMCPYYNTWSHMIQRCYDEKKLITNPTYRGCSVVKEWHTFSVFRSWMEAQDWKGKQIDKDLKISGNRIYSPAACMFISRHMNTLFSSNAAKRGIYPKGVSFNKPKGLYVAQCWVNGKNRNLGGFSTIKEAEVTYLSTKAKVALSLSNSEEALGHSELRASLIRISEELMQKAKRIIINNGNK